MIEAIISGGQTGADRAALDIAIELQINHYGWCPKNRLAEDGAISFKYNLRETDTTDVNERTKLNIRDSDGTIIFVPSLPVQVTDGTILTIKEVYEKKKPHLIIDFSKVNDITELLSEWVERHNIAILNIAGPRESQQPGTYQAVYMLLKKALTSVNKLETRPISEAVDWKPPSQAL